MSGRSSKSKGRPLVLPLTEEDIALQRLAVQGAQSQQAIFDRTVSAQGGLFDALNRANFSEGLVDSSRAGVGTLGEAIQKAELDRIQGGGISTAQRASIQGASSNALALAESDIGAFARSQFQELVSNLTPSLGLRPGDSPIQDRGGLIATEAVRQQGQAARDIRGQAFQAELGLPLEASGRNAAILGLQGQLAQEAFNRQLSLAETAIGTGLSAGAPAPISSTVSAVKQPKVAGQITKESSAGGGVGGG